MHKMERTPRILTIIGIVFEGFHTVVLWFISWLFRNIASFKFSNMIQEDMTPDEDEYFLEIFNWFGDFLLVLSIIASVFLIINIILFTRLIGEKYDEDRSKKIYLYQAIIGGFNLLSNQITGIMYLISGVMGYKGQKEMTQKDIRRGI